MSPRSGCVSRYKGSGLISSITSAAGNILNRAIDILPTELHIPGYQFCGPGTNLKARLARGDQGINKLDSACKLHDIAYSKYSDSKNRAVADRELVERAWERVKASDSSFGERAAALAVTNIMKAKSKFGGGKKKKPVKKKKCKCGIRKNKKNNKVSKKKGRGLYLRPYSGSGQSKKKFIYKTKEINDIPNKALSNKDIIKWALILKIPNFRGVFMRDSLPYKISEHETGVVNLDSKNGKGTHWVCYIKQGFRVQYFDSFGNLRPPIELQSYFNSGPYNTDIRYNYFPLQQEADVNCGHLCLDFLAVNTI